MGQYAGYHLRQRIAAVLRSDGYIDVHAVAGAVFEGLWRKVGAKSVAGGNRIHDAAESHRVVCGGHGVGVAEVYLVLAGAFLMVGAFRFYAHLLQGETYLPADVFALVLRGNVHIAGVVVWQLRRLAVFVQLKKIKLHLGAEGEGHALFMSAIYSLGEYGAGIGLEGSAVRVSYVAEHSYYLAML